jgi:hypothetical protein
MDEIKDQGRMNTKDRIDALMSLANFYREVRGARISREWRVTFGLWAALTTIAISAASIKAIPYWIVVAFVLLAITSRLSWLFFHFSCRDRAASLLTPDEAPPQRPNINYVPVAEILIPTFLSSAALVANWFR